jgi:hypothetical protein
MTKKILHLSDHYGCLKDHQYICNHLGLKLESNFTLWNTLIPRGSFRESKIIIENDLISKGGILLIDDVRSPLPKITSNESSDYGKAKYSIPYLEEDGFELVMDEYQVVMIKR